MLREEIYWEPWSIGGFTNFCRLKCNFFCESLLFFPGQWSFFLVKSQPCWLLPGIFFAAKLPVKNGLHHLNLARPWFFAVLFFVQKHSMHHTCLKSNFPGFLSLPVKFQNKSGKKKLRPLNEFSNVEPLALDFLAKMFVEVPKSWFCHGTRQEIMDSMSQNV